MISVPWEKFSTMPFSIWLAPSDVLLKHPCSFYPEMPSVIDLTRPGRTDSMDSALTSLKWTPFRGGLSGDLLGTQRSAFGLLADTPNPPVISPLWPLKPQENNKCFVIPLTPFSSQWEMTQGIKAMTISSVHLTTESVIELNFVKNFLMSFVNCEATA